MSWLPAEWSVEKERKGGKGSVVGAASWPNGYRQGTARCFVNFAHCASAYTNDEQFQTSTLCKIMDRLLLGWQWCMNKYERIWLQTIRHHCLRIKTYIVSYHIISYHKYSTIFRIQIGFAAFTFKQRAGRPYHLSCFRHWLETNERNLKACVKGASTLKIQPCLKPFFPHENAEHDWDDDEQS